MIKSAINHDTELPEGSRREVLIGYQYALYQHRKKLREERDIAFKTITVHQGRSTGKTIVKIQSTAEKGAETQNTIGGRQHAAERKGTQGALPHS
jgi:hypothetical protein